MATSSSIVSSKKLALIIGNNDYSRPESKLRHCINDAKDLSDSLKGIGFHVDKKFNLTNQEMVQSLKTFRKSIHDGDLVLFYFSGHGYQVKGHNYLMPVDDDEIESEEDVEENAVSVETTLDRLATSNRSSVTIFILDCCRKYWPKNTPKTKGK